MAHRSGPGRAEVKEIFSGRIVMSSGWPIAAPASTALYATTDSSAAVSSTAVLPSSSRTVPVMMFDVPMKPATKRVRGRS
jgi:hypothetical protein